MDRIRDLVVAGNSRQMADPAFVRELKGWLRFNPAPALAAPLPCAPRFSALPAK
jgi:hypothetical protein